MPSGASLEKQVLSVHALRHHDPIMLSPDPTSSSLWLDPVEATNQIVEALRKQLAEVLRRRGFVVAMSSGVDSSVCAALAVRAVGPERVFGLFLPERESDPRSYELALDLAQQLGIDSERQDIAPILEAAGCYRRRNEAIRRVVPEFRDDWGCKLVIDSAHMNITSLVVQPLGGEPRKLRLPAAEYREIVAASNYKQRV